MFRDVDNVLIPGNPVGVTEWLVEPVLLCKIDLDTSSPTTCVKLASGWNGHATF